MKRLVLGVTATCFLAAAIAGCGGSSGSSGRHYSRTIENNFLNSCVQNATQTAGAAGAGKDFHAICQCTLSKVESQYSESRFRSLEQQLAANQAPSADSNRLEQDAMDCARA
jgi:hypothetical protein